MQTTAETVLQVGRIAASVIAVCIVALLVISFLDRHPRRKRPTAERSGNDVSAGEVKDLP